MLEFIKAILGKTIMRNLFLKYKYFVLAASAVILIPSASSAARLYFDPAAGARGSGDVFTIKLKIDPEGQCINAMESSINFSENLEFVDFSTADSIFSLWINRPSMDTAKAVNSKKIVEFSGGIPGGFCGSPKGELEETNILAEAVFRVREDAGGEGILKIDPMTKVLINDGKGTEAPLRLSSAIFPISSGTSTSANDWRPRLDEDKIPPEPFLVEIQQAASVYGGKYFIVFSTTDKQSGIDRFEVSEERREEAQGFLGKIRASLGSGKGEAVWKRAESPYLLMDQELRSVILVKAFDKAGNTRVVKLGSRNPGKPRTAQKSFETLGFILAGLILMSLVLFSITRKKAKMKKNNDHDTI
jgi:hypothetical protein